jgi:cysteinyl-tRNA synthetase
MQSLRIYNTKTRTVEEFKSITPGVALVYSCGPTVYHYAHLGNLRAFIFADILRRTLEAHNYSVKHVINITDVGHLTSDGDTGEDKLEKGASREGKTVWEVAQYYENEFRKDLTLLQIPLTAYQFPRATDYIQEQIDLIRVLEEKGFTYDTSDGIYFDTAKFPHYGELAHLDIEGLRSGARVEENTEKRNVTDFALWKFSPKNEKRQMEWDSPWGIGFPGWHIECSAMSQKLLGKHFDIHTGGIDHISVHHENEIAQSESATGEPFVNYWMHVNFLLDTTGKMSKSSGDFLRLQTLTDKGLNPLAYRYFTLTAHYRKELTFSYEALQASSVAYTKLVHFVLAHRKNGGEILPTYLDACKEALANDLNSPEAIAVIWKMMKDTTFEKSHICATLLAIDSMLGLGLRELQEVHIPHEVEHLLVERTTAREKKDWATSDRIRDEIQAKGFTVQDTDEGQILLQG